MSTPLQNLPNHTEDKNPGAAASTRPISVAIAHHSQAMALQIEQFLKGGSLPIESAHFATLKELFEACSQRHFEVALLDLALEGKEGLGVFEELQAQRPSLPIITLASRSSGFGFASVERGARDYFEEGDLTAPALEKSVRCAIVQHDRRIAANQDVNLFDNLLENIPERIWFKDRKSRFIRINRALSNLFNLNSPEDAIDKTDFDYFTTEHAQPAFDDERLLLEEKVPAIQKSEKETFPDGRIHWALTTKMPLLSRDGQIVGTFGISHNITKLRETEEELENERNQLRIASRELSEKNARMESDLALAREIQLALLPRQYPTFPPQATGNNSLLFFDHRYIPAQAVGGDFFTIFNVTPTKAGILICDVMGHGPSAALVTAIVRTLCEDLRHASNDPGAFITSLNVGLQHLLKRVEDPMLCTAFYMTIDSENGKVEYCNAAHPSPILIDALNKRAFLISELDGRHGPVLGLTDQAIYPSSQTVLQHQDALLLFTDGLFEAPCAGDEEFGMDRLLEKVSRHISLELPALMDATLADITKEALDGFDDDVCLVSVQRR